MSSTNQTHNSTININYSLEYMSNICFNDAQAVSLPCRNTFRDFHILAAVIVSISNITGASTAETYAGDGPVHVDITYITCKCRHHGCKW